MLSTFEAKMLVKQKRDKSYTKCEISNGTAFIKHVVSTGLFRWTFKIENIVEPGKYWTDFVIGIIDSTKDLSHISNRFFCWKDEKRFNASQGEIIADHHESGRYGIVCKTNDVIEMELNMNELYVKYIINGKDYGKAFDVKHGSYKAAVYL